MEAVVVALRPQQHATVTSEFNPAAYDILLTDVRLANSDKTYGTSANTLKQLPKTRVSYDQEPAEALFAYLYGLTGQDHGGLKGKRAVFIPPDKNESLTDNYSDSVSKGTLYCIPIDSRDKLNPKVIENLPNTPGFYGLNQVMNTLNSNAYTYSKQTRQMLFRLDSWLREKHKSPGLMAILLSVSVESRLRNTVTNPAYYTESLPRHGQHYGSTSDLYNNRSIANEALAKMLAIEKCEKTIISPLFNTGLPYKNKVETNVMNRFWGMGKPDYSKITLPSGVKHGMKSQPIAEEQQEEIDSGNNSSDTKKNYSKSSSSKESYTISITDMDTWAPLEGARNSKNSKSLSTNSKSSTSDQRNSSSCNSKERKERTNLRESNSLSVVNETLTVTDIDSLIEGNPRDKGEPSWLEEFPLHKNAYIGDAKGVFEMLDEGYAVEQRDHDSWAPIHYAAWYGHLDAIGALLNEGKCSPNLVNDHGSTALHLAASNGHHYVAELLLNHTDTDVNAVDKEGKTALALCEGSDDPNRKLCAKLLARAPERPVPEIQVFLMDGTHRMLSMVSGANTTVQQIHQQMMKELELPESCGHLFTIWICSRNLQLQLKPDHKPIQHLNDWRRKIVSMLTDEDPAREDPQLFWRRDAILSIDDERKIAMQHKQAINLLFHEAYHNYIKSLYTCADQDAINLGSILMQLNQGDYDPRKVQNYFANERGLSALVPVAKLRSRSVDWVSEIQNKYRLYSGSLSNKDRSPSVLQQHFLALCWNLVVYGSAFFTGQIHLRSAKNRDTVYIGVNDIGVHIVHGHEKAMLKSFKYGFIEWHVRNKAILEIRQSKNGVTKGNPLSIMTRQAGLIHHLMSKLAQMNMAAQS